MQESWWLRTSFVLLSVAVSYQSVAISQLLVTSIYLALSIACDMHVCTNFLCQLKAKVKRHNWDEISGILEVM